MFAFEITGNKLFEIAPVKKPGSKTVTSAVRGIFETDSLARSEAMSLIKLG